MAWSLKETRHELSGTDAEGMHVLVRHASFETANGVAEICFFVTAPDRMAAEAAFADAVREVGATGHARSCISKNVPRAS